MLRNDNDDLSQDTKRREDLETRCAAQAAEIGELKKKAILANARVASLDLSLATREKAIAEQRAKMAELIECNRILKQGIETIGAFFRKLSESRSFHFVVYTARRFGLVSRTSRQCVEAIRVSLSATRKALRQAQQANSRTPMTKPADAFPPPAKSGQPLEGGTESDKANLKPMIDLAVAQRLAASAKNAIALPVATLPRDNSVCFVVFHQSGEHHLGALLSSFLEVNTLAEVEFNIVLQAGSDESRAVIRSFQDSCKINVLDFAGKRSFAYANNRAAEQTSATHLVFLNSRLVFRQDVVPVLLRCLQDRRIGLVSLRLIFSPMNPVHPGGVQHAGIKFRADPPHFCHRPIILDACAFITETPPVLEQFPAVTSAALACRRREFLALGGFCEDYLDGYENVDLCLSFRRSLGLRSVAANQVACIHTESATDEMGPSEAVRDCDLSNVEHLGRRHGWYLRRQILADKMSGRLFYSDEALTVAFAVTDATPTSTAGDFFSGQELAEACAIEFGWHVRYLSRTQDWYDLHDVDVLIVLLDSYELSKIRHAKPDLITIAWMRNWFERWVAGPDFDQYDLFLCSSQKSARWLRDVHRKAAWVFPLATNPSRFVEAKPNSRYRSDYCFTGSYWQFERAIESALQPQALDSYQFAIFGSGWETHPILNAHARGFLPYSEMPNVYASTRIVVDDANHVTKDWGSVNSRVFDALAAGALVITNGDIGAAEVFDAELPTYQSADELKSLLRRYLDNEVERCELVGRLQQRVFARHTYRHRARTLKRILISRARRGYRVSFKIDSSTSSEIQESRDFCLARGVGRSLAGKGHSFRIDCFDQWDRTECFGDDVVISLRGAIRFRPKPGQINLLCGINPTRPIEDEECQEFDHVFVASQFPACNLGDQKTEVVSPADPDLAAATEELLTKIKELDEQKRGVASLM